MIENTVIVDDEPLNLMLLKEYLKKAGVNKKNVFQFQDGAEALPFIQNNCHLIDLLITDYRMPKMNGVELMKSVREYLLKEENCHTDIIIFLQTAFDHDYIEEKYKLEDEFLKKPISSSIFQILFERYTNKEE